MCDTVTSAILIPALFLLFKLICSQRHQSYSRAYIDFQRPEDVMEFAEYFGGHVFVNEKGNVCNA